MPMHRERYPPDWEEISRRVREEVGNRCEWCGVANGWFGFRALGGFVKVAETPSAEAHAECRSMVTQPRCFRIVLTVAHIDHDPANNDRSNLAALCQRCHLRHDHEQHQANAAATRARKRAEDFASTGQQGLL